MLQLVLLVTGSIERVHTLSITNIIVGVDVVAGTIESAHIVRDYCRLPLVMVSCGHPRAAAAGGSYQPSSSLAVANPAIKRVQLRPP